jgi:hypothetical protein
MDQPAPEVEQRPDPARPRYWARLLKCRAILAHTNVNPCAFNRSAALIRNGPPAGAHSTQ